MSAGMGVGALDADVSVERTDRRKAVAAVGYYEQELTLAEEAAGRLAGKAERLRAQADEAEAAHAEAVAAVGVARERHEAAKAEVQ